MEGADMYVIGLVYGLTLEYFGAQECPEQSRSEHQKTPKVPQLGSC